MERKLIKQGGGGFTIYLPKKWVKDRGLSNKDNVNLMEKGNSLVVSGVGKDKSSINIKIHEDNKHDIYALLSHLYRKGFDKIKLINVKSENLREIKKVVNHLLLGFDITERGESYCIIENLSEPADQKYDSLIKRIFFIVNESLVSLKEDLEKNNFNNMQDMEDMKKNIDRYVFFCKRGIIKGRFEKNPIIAWEFLTFLFHIQHATYYLYKYLNKSRSKKAKSKKVIDFAKKLKEYFEYFEKAYVEKDIKFIHKINKLKLKYHFGNLIRTLEKAKGSESVALSYIREIYRLIQIGSSSILSDIFEKEYKLE